jgi:hypothetical protein
MKKMNYFVAALSLIMITGLYSCKKEKEAVSQSVSGVVFDATMNNIMLVTTAGDTLNISTMDADPVKVPGVLVNDSVEITYVVEKTDQSEILKATSLVVKTHSPYYYIAGTWVEPNPINASEVQGFNLNEDGTASSVNMATLIFENWNLSNSTLMLKSKSLGSGPALESTDTLHVVRLDADSLILARHSGEIIWRLGRQVSGNNSNK